MFALRALVLVVAWACSAGALAAAQLEVLVPPEIQIPTEIQVRHRAGQTFVTWRELATSGLRYRVYRDERPLTSAQDLKQAELLGEVDDKSSRNQGRSLASGAEHAWIIEPGGAELEPEQGLFVHSVSCGWRGPGDVLVLRPRHAFYAVTSVLAGREERMLVPGSNASRPGVLEMPAPPEPVLQNSGPDGELWGHWVSDRATPFQPALSPWPSRGFNFHFQPGTAPGAHGLVVRLHAAGQTYLQAWPQRFETPADVDGLALSDLIPYTSWSFWFGSHELLPGAPGAHTRVWNYTQERMLWTIDWISARLGAAHDAERVYVVGGSMGAIGGLLLLSEQPERFAAALLRNGLYDLQATDYRNPALFQRILGDFTLDLRMRDGLPVLQRTNAVFMAGRELERDWPILRTISGRNDETVGWSSAVGLMRGLAELGRPAVHYFDERTHNPNGHWRMLERTLLGRTFKTRRDQPALRFTHCSLDEDPGDGTRLDGDPVGTINGYLDYEPLAGTASARRLDFDVFLRSDGVLDDAPAPLGWAALGPWRTGAFAPAPGEGLLYVLRAEGRIVDEHVLFADEHGRVRTPPAPLSTTRRNARFLRDPRATPQPLWVGAAPIAGDDMQVLLHGQVGEPWVLAILWRGLRLHYLNGTFDASGYADLYLAVPESLRAGTELAVRGVIGTTPTPARTVMVQTFGTRPDGHVVPKPHPR